MTVGRSMLRKLAPLLALPSLLPSAHGAELDAAALIRSLARPAPATTAFTEVRLSPLLREPLVVSGELAYAGAAQLDRKVTRPYAEHTAIRGESVRVERAGEAPRSFALKRTPELRGLLNSFVALLAGDSASLERNFSVAASGTDAAWRLSLTPRDARTRRRLQEIEIVGQAALARCFTILNADGAASVMLLGDASNEPLPQTLTIATLREQCSIEQPHADAQG